MADSERTPYSRRLVFLTLFAAAIGYVEAMVVVYLRALYYPHGFAFPLEVIPAGMFVLEFFREFATIVILVSISALIARRFWERFGYFLIAFGLWDLFYYLWLKVALDWPATLFEWDVLFLIPLPWIGPVIAPALIALEMVVCGILITRRFDRGGTFSATPASWLLAVIATLIALWTFMYDLDATLQGQMPQPYPYWALGISLICYAGGFWVTWRSSPRTSLLK